MGGGERKDDVLVEGNKIVEGMGPQPKQKNKRPTGLGLFSHACARVAVVQQVKICARVGKGGHLR
jgi:hypothetical protein